MFDGGKQALSTLAARRVANGVFARDNKRQLLSTLAQTPSTPGSGRAVKGLVSDDYHRTLGAAISRGTPLTMSSSKAVIAPWGRLLARFPRKW
jgi:hypothetical protein